MLDIGMSELVIIGVVALVVVGPKDLPKVLRTAGQWIGKARRMAGEFQGQLNEAIREAELEDVKKSVDDLRSLSPSKFVADQLGSLTDDIQRVGADTQAELAKIETSVNADPGNADASSTFSEPVAEHDGASEPVSAPAMSPEEAVSLIDAAATQTDDLPPPVFDLTPAPIATAGTTPTIEPAAIAAAEPDAADKKATGA